jgi:hypothetical protein
MFCREGGDGRKRSLQWLHVKERVRLLLFMLEWVFMGDLPMRMACFE